MKYTNVQQQPEFCAQKLSSESLAGMNDASDGDRMVKPGDQSVTSDHSREDWIQRWVIVFSGIKFVLVLVFFVEYMIKIV